MIQRKQSLWLLLAAVCSFLTIKFPFYTGNIFNEQAMQSYQILDGRFDLIILILTITIAVTSIISIFLYSHRKKQMLYTFINFIVSIGTIVLYYNQTKKFVDGSYSISSLLTLIIPFALLLAFIGIFKDERLIKSADRLR